MLGEKEQEQLLQNLNMHLLKTHVFFVAPKFGRALPPPFGCSDGARVKAALHNAFQSQVMEEVNLQDERMGFCNCLAQNIQYMELCRKLHIQNSMALQLFQVAFPFEYSHLLN